MRFGMLAACLALGGCGGANEEQAVKGGSELTVTLPPTVPSEPSDASNAAAAVETGAPVPQAGFETVAATPTPKSEPQIERSRAAAEPEIVPAPPEVEAIVAPVQAEAAIEPAADARARPAGSSNWAAYIRRAGFSCDRVGSVEAVERSANPGFTYYRVQCGSGGTYQATNKRGHLFFRRWTG